MGKKQTKKDARGFRKALAKTKRVLAYLPFDRLAAVEPPVINVLHNEYVAWFYHPMTRRKIGSIGNVGVAYDVIAILKRLGFKVKVYDETAEE